MTYLTVKNGIIAIVKALGFKESDEIFDFDAMGENEYGNKFILNAQSGINSIDTEGVVNKYDDIQQWEIAIAFSRSSRGDKQVYDEMHKKRELIIRDVDDWANTQSFIMKLRYVDWEVEDLDSYFVLRIRLEAIDRITY